MEIFTLTNQGGMTARIANYGGRILSLIVPDRHGRPQDVVLGFDRPEDYLQENHQTDFGAAIGRYANRLGNGRITVDGKTYQLPQNNGPHCLHGGPNGWQYQLFDVESSTPNSLVLTLVSPDGDNGFPGEVHVRLAYTLTDDNRLDIRYGAVSNAPTVINMTNHSYFNLNGDGNTSILNHLLTIDADRYTPIDGTFLPVGTIESVAGTPFDFRAPKAVGRDIATDHPQLHNGHGYDHNWVLNTRGDDTRPCARLESPATGIVMEVFTSEPGMQVYTGNFLDGSLKGKGGIAYAQRSAICLETQKYPDSPNNHWPESNAFLNPGQTFSSHTVFAFAAC
jgi:aldose 1-epimerase